LDKETYINQKIDYLLQHYFDQSAQKMIAFLQKNKALLGFQVAKNRIKVVLLRKKGG